MHVHLNVAAVPPGPLKLALCGERRGGEERQLRSARQWVMRARAGLLPPSPSLSPRTANLSHTPWPLHATGKPGQVVMGGEGAPSESGTYPQSGIVPEPPMPLEGRKPSAHAQRPVVRSHTPRLLRARARARAAGRKVR